MSWKPERYQSVSPYLVVNGAQSVIEFAKAVFGAEELRRYEMPDGTIMHAEFRIDDSVLMVGDGGSGAKSDNVWLHVYVPDVDATYAKALAAGAVPVEKPAIKPGDPDKRGSVRDAHGNHWAFGTQQPVPE